MLYAFICDDTQSYKGMDEQDMGPSIAFMFEKLNANYEVRIVTIVSIPDGYTEA